MVQLKNAGRAGFARITTHGLITIAFLVAVLWGCLLLERKLIQRARMDTYRSLRDMRYLRMQQRIEPASQPQPQHSHPGRGPAVG